MKNTIKKLFLLIATSYIIQVNINCAASAVAAIFIPLLGAVTWENTADANNTFFFLVDTLNTNTSTFTGNENLTAGGQDHFTGSFTNHDIQFAYNADAGDRAGKMYKGTVNDASTQITLTSPDGLPALTLRKKQ